MWCAATSYRVTRSSSDLPMNRIHHRLDVPHTTCRHDCRLSACLPPTTLTHRRAAAKSRTSMRRPRAAYSATRRRRAERGGRPATYDCTRWFQLQVRHTSTTCTENSSAVVSRREISSVVRADPDTWPSLSPNTHETNVTCSLRQIGRASNWATVELRGAQEIRTRVADLGHANPPGMDLRQPRSPLEGVVDDLALHVNQRTWSISALSV